MYEASEVDSSAIVTGCEAAEVFEATEASLDAVSVLVDVGVMRDEDLAITLGRDHRIRLHACDQVA